MITFDPSKPVASIEHFIANPDRSLEEKRAFVDSVQDFLSKYAVAKKHIDSLDVERFSQIDSGLLQIISDVQYPREEYTQLVTTLSKVALQVYESALLSLTVPMVSLKKLQNFSELERSLDRDFADLNDAIVNQLRQVCCGLAFDNDISQLKSYFLEGKSPSINSDYLEKPADVIRILNWLKEENIKALFHECTHEYEFIIEAMETIYHASKSADQFVNDFFQDKNDANGLRFTREYFKFIYLLAYSNTHFNLGYELTDWTKKRVLINELKDFQFVHLPLLVRNQRDRVSQWLKVNAPKLELSFLEESMKFNFNLDLRFACYHFGYEAEKWFPPSQHEAWKFLSKWIYRISLKMPLTDSWDFIESAQKHRLVKEDFLKIREVLNEREVIDLLANSELERTRQFILDCLPAYP